MKNSKNGVAVIIVLGLLALLMVLGVAFSVSMRVERAGAANYSSTARTRQMVWAGLARAIGDINRASTNAYPGGDFLASRNATPAWGIRNTTSGVRLLTGKVRDHVPKVFLDLGYSDQRSEWLPLGVGDDREGYAAYMVLNLSDMLDANFVGGAVREGGTNAAEIVLRGIGLSSNNVATIINERENNGPFESLPEFIERTGLTNEVLTTYSRYLVDHDRTNTVYIGGGETNLLANRAVVVERLRQTAGISLPNLNMAAGIFTNLLDYLDADSIPRSLTVPSVEAVPMLNEVAMTNVVFVPPLGSNTLNAVGIRGGVETWYPFVQMNQAGLAFRIQGNYTMSLTVTAGGGAVLASVSSNATFQSSSLAYGVSGSARFPYHPFVGAVVIAGGVSVTNNPQLALSLTMSNLTVQVVGSGDVVDRVYGTFSFAATGPYNTFPAFSPVAYQALDPRSNWTNQPPYWSSTVASTMGSTNTQTLALLSNPMFSGADRLHCSDRGLLYSPLELGNLPRNIDASTILQTFRVFNHGASQPRDPILENFTTSPANGIVPVAQRGLVNANTRDTGILEAAFLDMPHPYVGTSPLGDATRTAVLDLIAAAQASGTVFGSLTDVLELDWRTALPALSDVEREAIAAYSTGLMGVRQNLFLVVIAASAASEGMGLRGQGQVGWRGRQRAVALVWRDPVANAQGLHDCFIRQFQWLD